MKIEIEENDLVYLLRCADASVTFDDYERGNHAQANKTRKFINKMIRKINKAAGCAKWAYTEMFGVLRCKDDKEV